MVRKWFACLVIIVMMMNTAACGVQKKARYEAEFLILFNTITRIVAYANSKEEFSEYSQLIYDELKVYHELYDIYNDYEGINNIKTINDHAGIKPIQVDQKIIDMLLFSKEQYILTKGRVNIAFGAVLKIWHKYRTEGVEDFENAKLPPMERLLEANQHTDIDKIIINEAESTVFLSDPDMSLDVGAIAKGYAAQRVAEKVREAGLRSGVISVGGNVCTIGRKPDGNKPWNVGVQNPNKEEGSANLMTLNLTDLSLVTSGNYERYYTVNGERYHHIIDTATLMPSEYFTSVTIICQDSGLADALSTAVFNMPFEEGEALINSMEGAEAVWIMHDGSFKYSKDFKALIKT